MGAGGRGPAGGAGGGGADGDRWLTTVFSGGAVGVSRGWSWGDGEGARAPR